MQVRLLRPCALCLLLGSNPALTVIVKTIVCLVYKQSHRLPSGYMQLFVSGYVRLFTSGYIYLLASGYVSYLRVAMCSYFREWLCAAVHAKTTRWGHLDFVDGARRELRGRRSLHLHVGMLWD